ncbi:hypothetical protein [Deinococcus yavapaiensis]|nr:hypothetical protein [Deinococcus yavapaiensis]
MKRAIAVLAVLSCSLASAQTVAELLTVTAIQSTLDKTLTIRLPTGTSFVSNRAYADKLAPSLLAAESPKFGEYQLFVARGYATRLADAYVANLKTSFAASGFMESASRTVKVGADTWTRTDFANDEGRPMALFVTKRADGVYFLTATGK